MIAILAKVTLVWALALAVVWSLRRGSAAMRHLVCASALLASALMPLVLLVPQKLEVLRVPLVVSAATAARVSAATLRPGTVLAWIWTCGSLLVLGRVALGFWRVRQVRDQAREIGMDGAVPVLEANVVVPVVVGLFRPAILMPAEAAAWPDACRQAALRHEAAHVRRRDLWTNMLAHFVCALYWFHPLVWMVAGRLREEQELACDDAAVVSGTSPDVYAEALLAAARFLRAKAEGPQGVNSLLRIPEPGCHMITNKSLTNRIARLVQVDLPRLSSTAALRRVALASAGVTLCVGLVSAQAPVKEPAAGPEQVYKVGNGITSPRVLSKVDPEYTEEAKNAKVEGTVGLTVVIRPNGTANDITVVRSLDTGLDLKAIEAVQKWHFEPATKDGEPVAVRAQIEINFKLK